MPDLEAGDRVLTDAGSGVIDGFVVDEDGDVTALVVLDDEDAWCDWLDRCRQSCSGNVAVSAEPECPKCGGPMRGGGIAMESTYPGSPDFIGGEVVTLSAGGPGRLVECGRKCSECGHSES